MENFTEAELAILDHALSLKFDHAIDNDRGWKYIDAILELREKLF